MYKRLLYILFLLTLLFSSSRAGIIITSPSSFFELAEEKILVKGLTDEDSSVELGCFERGGGYSRIVAIEPDSNGNWQQNFNLSGITPGEYFLTAETLTSKAYMEFVVPAKVRATVNLDRNAYERGTFVRITVNTSYDVDEVKVRIRPEGDSGAVLVLEKEGDLYKGIFRLSINARMGQWIVVVDDVEESFNGSFRVDPVRFDVNMVNPEPLPAGMNRLFFTADYETGDRVALDEIPVHLESPSGIEYSIAAQKIASGAYRADFEFSEEGTWPVSIEAREFNNLCKKSFNLSVESTDDFSTFVLGDGGIPYSGKVNVFLGEEFLGEFDTDSNGYLFLEGISPEFYGGITVEVPSEGETPEEPAPQASGVILSLPSLFELEAGSEKTMKIKIENPSSSAATVYLSKSNLPSWMALPPEVVVEAGSFVDVGVLFSPPSILSESLIPGSIAVSDGSLKSMHNVVIYVKNPGTPSQITGAAVKGSPLSEAKWDNFLAGILSMASIFFMVVWRRKSMEGMGDKVSIGNKGISINVKREEEQEE